MNRNFKIACLAGWTLCGVASYQVWHQHNTNVTTEVVTFEENEMPFDEQTFRAPYIETAEVDATALECMALNIYHEARGESEEGQIAVAHVTVNRAEHSYFPNSICGVVWQDSQFSWTIDGRSDAANDREAYARAESIAEAVLLEHVDDPTDGALFYHATYINPPSWTRHMTVADRIGIHIFYHWDGSWG